MADAEAIVKEGIADLEALLSRAQSDDTKSLLNKVIVNLEMRILPALKRYKHQTSALPKSLGDLSDLPSELLDQLNVAKSDELEDQIVTVINAYDGQANIDEILVGLYRKFKVVQQRRFIQNKLYRMAKAEMIFSIPDKKGAYSMEPVENGEAEQESETEEDIPQIGHDLDDEIPF